MRLRKPLFRTFGAAVLGLCLTTAARADWGDALVGAAVGAGISAAVDDDDDGNVRYRNYRTFRDPYHGGMRYYGGTRYYRTGRYWTDPGYYDNGYTTRRVVRRRVVRIEDDDDD